MLETQFSRLKILKNRKIGFCKVKKKVKQKNVIKEKNNLNNMMIIVIQNKTNDYKWIMMLRILMTKIVSEECMETWNIRDLQKNRLAMKIIINKVKLVY